MRCHELNLFVRKPRVGLYWVIPVSADPRRSPYAIKREYSMTIE